MSKDTRAGGKYTGNHTTLTPTAATVCDIAHASQHVAKISPGFIKSGLRPPRGGRRVKITEQDGHILLAVRDNTSTQEIHIYATNLQEAKLAIARGGRDAGLAIVFQRDTD